MIEEIPFEDFKQLRFFICRL